MEAEDPLVSIIIPCRNAEVLLPATLDSALAQTHRKLEVIVVDDGSTDGSASCVQSRDDPRLSLLRQPHRGAAVARNAGLAAARGRLVQFLDADDVLEPGKIAAQVALWRRHGDTVAYACAYRRFDHASGAAIATAQPPMVTAPAEWIARSWLTGSMLPPHAWLVPKALCERAGPWDESLLQNQDGEYFVRVLLAASRIEHLPTTAVRYRVGRRDSVSQQSTLAVRESLLLSCERSAAAVLGADGSAQSRRAVAALFMGLAVQLAHDGHLALAEAAHRRAREHWPRPAISVRGRMFRAAAAIIGWRRTARLAALRSRLTSRYRTG